MTLQAEFQLRYAAQKVIELTNNNDVSATTVNDTTLDEAAQDAIADFLIYAGLVYDNTVNTHIAVAVKGVEFYLNDRIGVFGGDIRDGLFEKWKERLRDLAKITSRDRILPKSNSNLDVTEDASDGKQKPDFDSSRFTDLVPGPPRLNRNATDNT